MKLRNIMLCGCKLKQSEIIIKSWQVNKKQHRQNQCPKHGGHIIAKQITCNICGKIVNLKSSARASKYCSKCKKKIKSNYMKEYYHNKQKEIFIKTRFDNLRDNSKWDCQDRKFCTGFFQNFDSMPCKNCAYYVLVPIYDQAA